MNKDNALLDLIHTTQAVAADINEGHAIDPEKQRRLSQTLDQIRRESPEVAPVANKLLAQAIPPVDQAQERSPAYDTPAPKRIAMFFDNDKTLTAPGYDVMSEYIADRTEFSKSDHASRERDLIEKEGYGPAQASGKSFFSFGEFTKEDMQDFAKTKVPMQEGLETPAGQPNFFDQIRSHAAAKGYEVEFHMITAGMEDIGHAVNERLGNPLTTVTGCKVNYDENGIGRGTVRSIDFSNKADVVRAVQKGIYNDFVKNPNAVNHHVDPKDYHVRPDHVVVVGDGDTDIGMFREARKAGGYAVAIGDRAQDSKGFIQNSMVDHLGVGYIQGPQSTLDFFKKVVDNVAERDRREELSKELEQSIRKMPAKDASTLSAQQPETSRSHTSER